MFPSADPFISSPLHHFISSRLVAHQQGLIRGKFAKQSQVHGEWILLAFTAFVKSKIKIKLLQSVQVIR